MVAAETIGSLSFGSVAEAAAAEEARWLATLRQQASAALSEIRAAIDTQDLSSVPPELQFAISQLLSVATGGPVSLASARAIVGAANHVLNTAQSTARVEDGKVDTARQITLQDLTKAVLSAPQAIVSVFTPTDSNEIVVIGRRSAREVREELESYTTGAEENRREAEAAYNDYLTVAQNGNYSEVNRASLRLGRRVADAIGTNNEEIRRRVENTTEELARNAASAAREREAARRRADSGDIVGAMGQVIDRSWEIGRRNAIDRLHEGAVTGTGLGALTNGNGGHLGKLLREEQGLYRAFDTDSNGTVDFSEFERLRRSYDISYNQAAALGGGDARNLSYEEFEAMARAIAMANGISEVEREQLNERYQGDRAINANGGEFTLNDARMYLNRRGENMTQIAGHDGVLSKDELQNAIDRVRVRELGVDRQISLQLDNLERGNWGKYQYVGRDGRNHNLFDRDSDGNMTLAEVKEGLRLAGVTLDVSYDKNYDGVLGGRELAAAMTEAARLSHARLQVVSPENTQLLVAAAVPRGPALARTTSART